MATQYVYTPLARRHIRLLQVWVDEDTNRSLYEAMRREEEAERGFYAPKGAQPEPSVTRDEETVNLMRNFRVRGRFITVNLDCLPHSYRAVSYVWGNPAARGKLWFDDDTYLEITNSAFEVLIWIALAGIEDYFWLDALCINQQENNEKNHQVQMMYDVYSKAQTVIAWTGQPIEESRVAMEFAAELYHEFRRLKNAKVSISKAALVNIEGFNWPSPKWIALARYLQRPFFRRLWIVQEMVAAREIILTIGVFSVPWMVFAEVAVAIGTFGLKVLIEVPDESGKVSSHGLEGLYITFSLRVQIRLLNRLPPLPYVISRCQYFGSTDPRDKIFALLSMSSLTDDEALAPDYNRSANDIYADTARILLTRSCDMISLLYVAGIGYSRTIGPLPSWAPDWSSEIGATSFGTTADSAILTGHELYYACGQAYKLEVIPSCFHSTSLLLKGRVLDIVRSHHEEMPIFEAQLHGPSRENSNRYFKWLLKLCHIFPETANYPTGVPLFPDAFSHTLVAGTNPNGKMARDAVDPQFVDSFAMSFVGSDLRGSIYELLIPRIIRGRIEYIDSIPSPPDDENALTLTNESLKSVYQAASRYNERVLRRRRFFTTSMGYIGMGPLLMQEDDIVCLLYGAKVPFLIRKRKEGGYLLVGECYVHGLMHGEGMFMGEEQDIILR